MYTSTLKLDFCRKKRLFKPYPNERDSVKQAKEKRKKLYNLEQMILRGKSRFLHYPPVHFLPNHFGSSQGLGFRENACQPIKTWTWTEDLRFWCEPL